MNLGEPRDDISSSSSDINKRSNSDIDKVKTEVEDHLSSHSIQIEDNLHYPLSQSGGLLIIREGANDEEEGSPYRINSSDAAAQP